MKKIAINGDKKKLSNNKKKVHEITMKNSLLSFK